MRAAGDGRAVAGVKAVTAAVLRTAAAVSDLVIPMECPCGTPGRVVCDRCRDVIWAGAYRIDGRLEALQIPQRIDVPRDEVDYGPLLPVYALGNHEPPLRDLVLAVKNGGLVAILPELTAALYPAVLDLAGSSTRREAQDGGLERELAVVPIPSRRSRVIARGEDHVALMARQLAKAVALHGEGMVQTRMQMKRLLGIGGRGQRGLGGAQRRAQRVGMMAYRQPFWAKVRCREHPRRTCARAAQGRRAIHRRRRSVRESGEDKRADIILVDDVVTTGATLKEAHRVLTAHGHRILGAVCLSAAPAPITAIDPPLVLE